MLYSWINSHAKKFVKGKEIDFFSLANIAIPHNCATTMTSITLGKTKIVVRGILFITSLALFYILFMKSALEKFIDGATTIVQSQEQG